MRYQGVVTLVVAIGVASSSGIPMASAAQETTERPYLLEQIGDAAVVQLYADGFEALSVREKTLIWHLYQAALAGRDIYYDQRYEHSLEMREVLEEIITHPDGVDPGALAAIHQYAKLFWLNTGPFNNLTARKFVVETTTSAFGAAIAAAARGGATFPTHDGETLTQMVARMTPLFFDRNVDPLVTNKTPAPGEDMLLSSANNLYKGVSMADLDRFEEQYPLTSRLVKVDGELVEEVYKIGGKYSDEIAEIIRHLDAAVPYASEPMAKALRANIAYYRTGAPVDQRAYDIAWVEDVASSVDTINGFTEVYMDARGAKGAWEALVFHVNPEKTGAIKTLAANAQWFEDRMPWDPTYRKEGVTGITANAIDVVFETGDSGPVTPIGINLPNDQTVRERYGSKSVSLSNVNEAYDRSRPGSFRQEFAWTPDEVERSRRWGSLAGEMTTNMHEVIGHASGKLAERLGGSAQPDLREQYSALEEGRADLIGLYFLADPKLVELGVLPADAQEEIVRTEYEGYTRNALVQLRRVREGTQIAEDHMRNRQMIVHWLMANTDAIETRMRDGKTFYVMTDWRAFRDGVATLLAEVQRIKSEGDYDAARALFETHGIHFDPALRDEIVARVDAIGLPSYSGFVQPRLEPVLDASGAITDVTISYPQDLTTQMLEFSGKRLPAR
jgi:dipeptidyl-peptidase-3